MKNREINRWQYFEGGRTFVQRAFFQSWHFIVLLNHNCLPNEFDIIITIFITNFALLILEFDKIPLDKCQLDKCPLDKCPLDKCPTTIL